MMALPRNQFVNVVENRQGENVVGLADSNPHYIPRGAVECGDSVVGLVQYANNGVVKTGNQQRSASSKPSSQPVSQTDRWSRASFDSWYAAKTSTNGNLMLPVTAVATSFARTADGNDDSSFFNASAAETVVEVDAVDSDNDFGLSMHDDDEDGVDETDNDADVCNGNNVAELRFCQQHIRSFMMAANPDDTTRGSVFFGDQLPPIPPPKISVRNSNITQSRTNHLDQRAVVVMRSKHHSNNSELAAADRSFGFYEGDDDEQRITEMERASLASSASISSLVMRSRGGGAFPLSASHPQILTPSLLPVSHQQQHNRLSSAMTTDTASADGFDSLSANSSFSTGASGGAATARDNVRECLEKEPHERTDDDIEVLLDFIQRLPAFANMTQSVRRALCAAMVFAAVKDVGTVVMHDGEELDSWSVLINGHVEIEYKTDQNNSEDGDDIMPLHARAELHVGDSFGVIEPTMERLYHQGTMRTLCDDCQFVCVEQAKFCAILCQGKAYTSAFEEQGRTVMVIEHRLIDPASQRRGPVVIKATAQQLIEHLMADDVGTHLSGSQPKTADPTYAEDFLLTYRIFLASPLEISQRLMNWFTSDAALRDKVLRTVLVWINNHFVDFEHHPALMSFLEQFISALAANERTSQLRLMYIACTAKARQRMITLTRSRRDETLNFSVLGGWERGCGVFVCYVAENCKAMQAGLRRGDQILKVNGIAFERITHEKALEVLRTATHLAITVQSNLFGFRDMLVKPTTASTAVAALSGVDLRHLERAVNAVDDAVECIAADEPTDGRKVDAATVAPPPAGGTLTGFETLNTRRKFVKALMRMNWRSKPGPLDSIAAVVAASSSSAKFCTDALNLELPAASVANAASVAVDLHASETSSELCAAFGAAGGDFSGNLANNNNRLSNSTSKSRLLNWNAKPSLPLRGATASSHQRLYHCLSNPDLRATLAELDINAKQQRQPPTTKPSPPLAIDATALRAVGTSKLSKLSEEACTARYSNLPPVFTPRQIDHVIKLFLPNQSFKYMGITDSTTAREVVLLGLNEFQLLLGGGSADESLNFSLYQVSVVAGGVTRQRRLADTAQDLAETLPLNARYYLKNNMSTSVTGLVPDAVAHEMWKESQVEFLQLNMLESAAQLTLQDFAVFRKIEPTEYVDELWPLHKRLPYLSGIQANKSSGSSGNAATATPSSSAATGTNKTNLTNFTELSNRQMFWVVNEVCRHRDSPARRARVLKNFIKLAQYCYAIRNFNSCFAIVFGLGHAAITRLKASWERVPHKHIKQLRALESLMDPSRNMSKYRQLLAKYQHSPPLIPFYPIVKKDLTFLNDGNATFETIQQRPDSATSADSDSSSLFLVNFEKLRMFAREMRQLRHYASVPYNAEEILSSTYFADLVVAGDSSDLLTANGGVAAPLLRRRTRPASSSNQNVVVGADNFVARNLPSANKATLLALNLASSAFATTNGGGGTRKGSATAVSDDGRQPETCDAAGVDVVQKSSSLFSTTNKSSTMSTTSLKKLFESRQMMRRVKLYLNALEIVQDEDQLYASSQLCEPAAGGSSTNNGTVASKTSELASKSSTHSSSAADKKAAASKSDGAMQKRDSVSAERSVRPQQKNAYTTSSKPMPSSSRATVSFVRRPPASSSSLPRTTTVAAAVQQQQQHALGSTLKAQQPVIANNDVRSITIPQQQQKLRHAAANAAAQSTGLPKFGQQSPHAVQKLLSLAEKARPHQLPKFPSAAAARSSAYQFNHNHAEAFMFPTTSGMDGNVGHVYGGPPPNSQRLLPALRRASAVVQDGAAVRHNRLVPAAAANAGGMIVPHALRHHMSSSSFAAAGDENAYQRYHFTPAVVAVVPLPSSVASSVSAHDLRAHPIQVTSVAGSSSGVSPAKSSSSNEMMMRQQQRLDPPSAPTHYRHESHATGSDRQHYVRQPAKLPHQSCMPRMQPAEPCNTSLTSQESVPDSGFSTALHVSATSGSIQSISSEHGNDSFHAPSVDDVSSSVGDNNNNNSSPASRRQQDVPHHMIADEQQHALHYHHNHVHPTHDNEKSQQHRGGDGTLTNSNRQRSRGSMQQQSKQQQPPPVDDSRLTFALSRC